MEHDIASTLLTEYAVGRLDASTRSELQDHLAACAECREVAALVPGVRAALQEHGSALFDAHPTADVLAQFALGAGDRDAPLETHELARIAAHVRACPTCTGEVALARRAQRTAWLRTPQAWLGLAGREGSTGLLRPALVLTAVAAVAMLYPAYLGLVRYPQLRRDAARSALALQEARGRGRAATSSGPWDLAAGSPGAAILTLTGPTRESGQAPGAEPPPTVVLRYGQPYLPVLVAYELPVGHSQRLDLRVLRGADASEVWHAFGTLDDVWSRDAEAMVLLVPAAPGRLTPGAYALEIRWGDGPDEAWRSAFRVEIAPPPTFGGDPAQRP